MKLNALYESVEWADQVRSLHEGAGQALQITLLDLATCLGDRVKWVLAGGLAVGFHARPRGTNDIDIFILNDGDIDSIKTITSTKFKGNRAHAITHRSTGVEVELLSPEFLKRDPQLVGQILSSADSQTISGVQIPVVSREGLVAAKLCRMSSQDEADIIAVLKTGPVNVDGFSLQSTHLDNLEKLRQKAKAETDSQLTD